MNSSQSNAHTTPQPTAYTVGHPVGGTDEAGGRAASMDEVDAGRLLKQAREAKGLALGDLSRTTKISRSILTALEAGDVAHLPSGIYTRGFVKSYAREVGLDPEEMAELYLGYIEHVPSPVRENARAHLAAPATRDEMMRLDDDTAMILAGVQARRVGWLVTACCAIGLVVYVWSFGRPRTGETAPTESAAPADAARAASASPSEPDVVRADSGTLVVSGPLHIELRPSGLCWVIVTVDGEQVLAKLLHDGEQQTFTANDELLLRIGDPGAFTYSINGRNGRPLGRAGEVVNVRITRANVREFIQS